MYLSGQTQHPTMTLNRQLSFVLLLLVSISAFSQERTLYFTVDGAPAPADSAQKIRKGVLENGKWHVLEYDKFIGLPFSEAWYLDADFLTADGPYIQFQPVERAKIATRGQFDHGKKMGLWISFSNDGVSTDSTFYADNHVTSHRGYYLNGRLRDSVWTAPDGTGISRGYWEDGKPEHTGQVTNWEKSGPWSYYTRQGILCSVETMQADTIASATDYDAAGKNPRPHKGDYEMESEYRGGVRRWLTYLGNAMSEDKLPKNFLEGKTPQGTVVVEFIVDEQGQIGDVRVQQSVCDELDVCACNIIRKSGRWTPGVQHNRPVKTYKRQPLTFRLE